jgi:hypothetical protein
VRTNLLAIVSKATYETLAKRDGSVAEPGEVWPIDRYASANPKLRPLAFGGSLYLVTVRAGDLLWLVGVLHSLTFSGLVWMSKPNKTPVTDITRLVPKLRFSTGRGLVFDRGRLGQALQTPRRLNNEDMALLEGLRNEVE